MFGRKRPPKTAETVIAHALISITLLVINIFGNGKNK